MGVRDRLSLQLGFQGLVEPSLHERSQLVEVSEHFARSFTGKVQIEETVMLACRDEVRYFIRVAIEQFPELDGLELGNRGLVRDSFDIQERHFELGK